MRETAVKRISFFLEFLMLYEVYGLILFQKSIIEKTRSKNSADAFQNKKIPIKKSFSISETSKR